MAAELARLFPKGLKHEEAERREQRHPPPFRFVPDKVKDKEDGDETSLKSISVELAPKSTMKVVPHSFTNVENFLLYQGQHDYILNQQEAKPKWISLSLVLNDTEVKTGVLLLIAADVISEKEKKLIEKIGGTPWFDRPQNERDHRESFQLIPANVVPRATRRVGRYRG